jgi:asparagine synthase (glutamine-hydrolysing)
MIGRHDPGLLAAMTGSLRHRGPDGDGLHVEGPLGLGHRRLAVLDLAGGAQPMTSADGQRVITLQRRDLQLRRAAPGAAGRRPAPAHPQGDTEVLLAGFTSTGASRACWRACAACSRSGCTTAHRETLWLARDHLGIKPLYYATLADGALLFGSEPKALLCCPEVDRGLDLESLDAYLDLFYIPPPRSIFAGIRQLPPGHWLRWCDGRSTLERWWDPQPRPPTRSFTASRPGPRRSSRCCARRSRCTPSPTYRSAPSSRAASTRPRSWP